MKGRRAHAGLCGKVVDHQLTDHRVYRTRLEAIWEIKEYIEVFYNRKLWQTRLGFLSPAVYEKKLFRERQAA